MPESDNTHGQREVGSGGRVGPGRPGVTAGRRLPTPRLPRLRTPAEHLPAEHLRLTMLAALSAAGCLVVAACSSGGSPTSSGSAGPSSTASAHAVTAASAALSITPGNGARTASPAKGVVVKASEGKIQSVTVTAGHDAVERVAEPGAHGVAEHLGAAAVARATPCTPPR